MTVSITNWHTAGGKLREVQDVCEALYRDDQPEKTEHLTQDEIWELFLTITAIVEFCTLSLDKKPNNVKTRDYETYQYARTYLGTLTRVLAKQIPLPEDRLEVLLRWVTRMPGLPSLSLVR